ncbi:hypothetical protein [Cellulomonas bogoriensis]|uniref:DUF4398 domain-containing protein n=1 Tax=Cellulomonas bogoriensis 69B4 = DSM 16987 TaxID=1386082 RepID=A0A0A0C1H9_9CELL|nr:hypothetical protein [Cellulomonas bogoriensis]KGM14518.1 hypothetical protein N869_08825 [Cellulomonas bogoriensis 69B4 = DSM 16987]
MRRRAGAWRWCVAAGAGALLWAASACSPAVDLDPRVATELQEAVEDLARAAAEGRYDSADVAADRVREMLERAAEDEAVSLGRYRAIDDALTRTQAEIDRMRVEEPLVP